MKVERMCWKSPPNLSECGPATHESASCNWKRVSRRSVAPLVEEPATSVPERESGSSSGSGSFRVIRTTGRRSAV